MRTSPSPSRNRKPSPSPNPSPNPDPNPAPNPDRNPPQVQMMRNSIDAVWCVFDDDGSGSIERDEFLRPGDGLADTIIATVEHG